jgi:hypothetical protein
MIRESFFRRNDCAVNASPMTNQPHHVVAPGCHAAARRHADVHKLRTEVGHFLKPPTALREGPLAALIATEVAKAA